jgi:hypothetical protein
LGSEEFGFRVDPNDVGKPLTEGEEEGGGFPSSSSSSHEVKREWSRKFLSRARGVISKPLKMAENFVESLSSSGKKEEEEQDEVEGRSSPENEEKKG